MDIAELIAKIEKRLQGKPGPRASLFIKDEDLRDIITALQQQAQQRALAHDTAFWLDCRYDKSPRGESVCKLEGTKVCALCTIDDLRADLDAVVGALQEAHRVFMAGHQGSFGMGMQILKEALARVAKGGE